MKEKQLCWVRTHTHTHHSPLLFVITPPWHSIQATMSSNIMSHELCVELRCVRLKCFVLFVFVVFSSECAVFSTTERDVHVHPYWKYDSHLFNMTRDWSLPSFSKARKQSRVLFSLRPLELKYAQSEQSREWSFKKVIIVLLPSSFLWMMYIM